MLLLLNTSASLVAQEERAAAYVLETGGPVEFRATSKDDYITLRPGTTLNTGATVVTGPEAFAQLLFEDNTQLRVEAKKNFNVKSRKATDLPAESGLFGQITKRAATRAVPSAVKTDLLFPRDTKVLSDALVLRWQGGPGSGYAVHVREKGAAEEKTFQCDAYTYEVKREALQPKAGTTYEWCVTSGKDAPWKDTGSFSWLDGEESPKLQADAEKAAVKAQLKGAPAHVQKAQFYASKGAYAEQERELLAAMDAAGDKAGYKILLEALYRQQGGR